MATKKKTTSQSKSKNKKITVKDKKFLAALLTEDSQAKAYKKAHPDVSDNSAAAAATRKKNDLLKNVNAAEYMNKLEEKVVDSPTIASAERVLQFLTDVMDGKVPDQFGLDPALNDRLKAAEMLAKKWKLLTDKLEVKGDVSVADIIHKARMRASKATKQPTEDKPKEVKEEDGTS